MSRHTFGFKFLYEIFLVQSILFAMSYSIASVTHVHEQMMPRSSFIKIRRANVDGNLTVIIAVKQLNLEVLEKEIFIRSTPGSEYYQQWMSFEEVGNFVQNEVAVSNVLVWLNSIGAIIEHKTRYQEYISASASVATWENALDAVFYDWFDAAEDRSTGIIHTNNPPTYITRAEKYSLPPLLYEYVTYLFNVCDAPPIISKHFKLKKEKSAVRKTTMMVKESQSISRSLSAPSEITVSYLDSFYHIPSNKGSALSNQSVFETSKQYFSPSDLTIFQQTYGLTVQSAIDIGGYSTEYCSTSGSPNNCFEGNLDLQYIMGISQFTSSIYWYCGSGNPFLEWILEVADEKNPPKVNSISWGAVEQDVGAATLKQFNAEAMKLALRGVTITASSGDEGVAYIGCSCDSSEPVSSMNCACQADSSSSTTSWAGSTGWTGQGYFPSFPATCPYITAVGATMGNDQPSIVPFIDGVEIACQSQLGGVITSGGGFSTYYGTPFWQKDTVEGYFSKLSSQPSSGYNQNGRGIPDVSLLGVSYAIVIAGSIQHVYGTSCSAPVFAGMISLLNSARYTQNMSSCGFLNPTLYAKNHSHYYNDVTSGSNNCCAYSGTTYSDAVCCESGFSSTTGWDPVTGWGSIYYTQLAAMFNISSTYTSTLNAIPPRNFFGVSATIMAILILALLSFALFYPIGVFIRRKCLPKSSHPDEPEDYQDFKNLSDCVVYCCNSLTCQRSKTDLRSNDAANVTINTVRNPILKPNRGPLKEPLNEHFGESGEDGGSLDRTKINKNATLATYSPPVVSDRYNSIK